MIRHVLIKHQKKIALALRQQIGRPRSDSYTRTFKRKHSNGLPLMKLPLSLITILIALLTTAHAHAQSENFSTGPVIPNFGENAVIKNGLIHAEQQSFKVVFDLSAKNETDKPLRQLNGIARFINMHARAGVPPENIHTAAVVHGGASFELLSDSAYQARFGKANPSAELVQALLNAGTKIELCGQSAAYHGIEEADLADGVNMSLSAMTSNALLQQNGYTLNPF
jgi:intracellular sulfur oxidation DsrE/DsrF family protein